MASMVIFPAAKSRQAEITFTHGTKACARSADNSQVFPADNRKLPGAHAVGALHPDIRGMCAAVELNSLFLASASDIMRAFSL